jgi:Dna[CI] antecedent, DciA
MIPVHRFMPDALAAVLRKAPLTPEKVAFAWRTAVGATVDRASTVRLDGQMLRVHTRDAAWQREIERSAALIRARLDALLGAGVVRGLDVSIDS